MYHNYKGTFSMVLMALVDASYCFTVIDVGSYGSSSDGGIFSKSCFGRSIAEGTLNIPPRKSFPGAENNEKLPHVIDGVMYHNYKGTFSMVLMALVDASYCFTVIGSYGSSSDGGIFSKTCFGRSLAEGTLNLPPRKSLAEGTLNLPPRKSLAEGTLNLPPRKSLAEGTLNLPPRKSLAEGKLNLPPRKSLAEGPLNLPPRKSLAEGPRNLPPRKSFPGAENNEKLPYVIDGVMYHNYKGTFSMVLMALVDASYCFTVIDVGSYGSSSDGGISSKSFFGRSLAEGTLNLPPRKSLAEGTLNLTPRKSLAEGKLNLPPRKSLAEGKLNLPPRKSLAEGKLNLPPRKSLAEGTLNLPPRKSLPGAENNEKLPHVIVGDEAFPMKPNLMRPYPG